MIIKKIAVGNSTEAFVEDGFTDGLNIISSDDNNKGKTIAMQSMMYAIGNEPTFPTTFDYKKYYYYIEFEENNKFYRVCRYGENFALIEGKTLLLFDSVSELKRYWTKHIFKLPEIVKNQISKIVDPVLFFQLFFVGQDKKDTSNISHSGLYNKKDFEEMIYSILDLSGYKLNLEEIEQIKAQLTDLKDEKKLLLKQHKILSSKKAPVQYLSAVSDRSAFENKVEQMDKINAKITELRKARNLAANRKSKWENTIKELKSLNRNIDVGELKCMDCDSKNIAYATSTKRTAYSSHSKADGLENSGPRSVRITGKSRAKISVPSSFCRKRNTWITDSLLVLSIRKASIKLQFLKSMVRITLPGSGPTTVSISTTLVSGLISRYSKKSA